MTTPRTNISPSYFRIFPNRRRLGSLTSLQLLISSAALYSAKLSSTLDSLALLTFPRRWDLLESCRLKDKTGSTATRVNTVSRCFERETIKIHRRGINESCFFFLSPFFTKSRDFQRVCNSNRSAKKKKKKKKKKEKKSLRPSISRIFLFPPRFIIYFDWHGASCCKSPRGNNL